jgi:hypothetical protein
MKKLIFLALLPLAVACNKNNDSVAPSNNTSKLQPALKQSSNTAFTTAGALGNDDIYHGTFSVSGLLSGTGTTAESVNITMPSSGNPQAMMNATYTFHSTQTFTFDDNSGSITIVTAGQWAFTNATLTHASGSGNWNIVSGTGSYSNLHGNGTVAITDIDFSQGAPTVTDVYNGSLHYYI